MASTIITTIEIGSRKFPVRVSVEGRFYADDDGETISASTLDALKQRLRMEYSEIRRCEVPALLQEPDDALVEIVLIGRHARTHNVLYKQKGKAGTHQMYSYGDRVIRPLSPDEHAEHKALRRAQREANAAVDKWITARRLRAGVAVDRALKQGPKAK